MKKIVFFCFFLLILGPVLFAGGETETTTTSDEVVEVEFWHLDARPEQTPVWQKMADDFMAANPNIQINITALENEAYKTKLTTVMQSGDPPDIFRSWGGGVMNEYAEAGLLRDITSDVKRWPTDIGSGAIGVYSYKDVTYGVPYDMGAVGMWYNKDLLASVGYSNPPETGSDLLDCVVKLKAAGITPIALGEGDKWPGHFWWVYLAIRIGGQDAFDRAYQREGSFADETFVKAGELLLELTALDPFQAGFLSGTYNDQSATMGNGDAAIELMGQWAPDSQKGNSESGEGLGDKLGFFPFPAVEGGEGELTDTMGGRNGYIVGKNAPDEAILFLQWITSVENNALPAEADSPIQIIPTVAGADKNMTDPLKIAVQSLVSEAEYYQLYYDQYLPPAVGEVVKDITQALFAGTMTPEEAAQAVEDSFAEEME